jgi:hypothetical protein
MDDTLYINYEKMKRLHSVATILLPPSKSEFVESSESSGGCVIEAYLDCIVFQDRKEEELIHLSGLVRPYLV